jgi:hypothetical protein
MAEFIVSGEGLESRTIQAGTAYGAASRYAETVLTDDAMDDDEFEVTVLEKATGKKTGYTLRAEVTTHWVVTRRKDDEDEVE